MSESVKELVNGRMRTEKLKRKFERLASERLGGGELKERPGEELMPTRLSKGLFGSNERIGEASGGCRGCERAAGEGTGPPVGSQRQTMDDEDQDILSLIFPQ